MYTEDTLRILYWPDGTWCYQEELPDFLWKSDDYSCVDITFDEGCDEYYIEELVGQFTGEH